MPRELIRILSAGETDSEEDEETDDGGEEEEDESTEEEGEEDETEVEQVNEVQLLEVEDYIPVRQSPRVSDGEGEKRRSGKVAGEEKCIPSGAECGSSSQCEFDGLFCAICMEAAWTSGDHHVCCLPCGHIYGFSCIRRWLQKNPSSRKCPQCKKKCALKDVRKLFALQIVATDGETLKIKEDWKEREIQWRKRENELQMEVQQLTKRTKCLEHLLEEAQSATLREMNKNIGHVGHSTGSNVGLEFSRGPFTLLKEFQVDGGRLFGIDVSNHSLLLTRRLPGIGGASLLSRISLLSPFEREDMFFPPDTKAIRDLRISPFNSLVLYASFGKKLTVFSAQSSNVVLAYDLPVAAWSCSWDMNNSHHLYAGLQNGSLMAFDMRQTARPIESVTGLTSNVIHTIHSLPTAVISASSGGIFHWSFAAGEMPFLVPEAEDQGACVSLAYSHHSDDIVASFRPKIQIANEMGFSQPLLTPAIGQAVQGSHILLKRQGTTSYQKLGAACANVNDVRLSRSTIINVQNKTFFASGDEATGELILQELPSFNIVQRLKPLKLPIHDVNFTGALGWGLLGCLSEDTLQLFRAEC